MNKKVLYYIWLAESFSYGSVKYGQILEKEPDAAAFYEKINKTPEEFSFLTASDINALKKHSPNDYRQLALESKRKNIHIMCYDDEAYPIRLKQIESPPPVLYYCGDPTILSGRCVGMVGTRYPSEYGKKITFKIASELAAYGIVVLSGCAGGIDAEAHKGALEEGKTVAVLGTPLDRTYPAFNTQLKREIYKQGGLLITEFPIGAKVNRSFFPVRNRLISAMSDSVLIMEAPKRSGALITAAHAIEQGKDLFCLPPADITNKRYDGVKDFLRDGARPLLGAEDVIESYRFHTNPFFQNLPKWESLAKKEEKVMEKIREKKEASLSDGAKLVLAELSERPHDAEELMQNININPNEIFGALTELELADLITKSGNGYCKK